MEHESKRCRCYWKIMKIYNIKSISIIGVVKTTVHNNSYISISLQTKLGKYVIMVSKHNITKFLKFHNQPHITEITGYC